jgi:hypothetical protein
MRPIMVVSACTRVHLEIILLTGYYSSLRYHHFQQRSDDEILHAK